MADTQLVISGNEVQLRSGRKRIGSVPIRDFVQEMVQAAPTGGDMLLPLGVRMLARRAGGVVGLVMELPPQARSVRWIRDDSKEPFGPDASYQQRFLGFPYVVLVFVLSNGAPTGFQELYYRREPLCSADDELLLPNLPNVAEAYEQRCWLCLQHLRWKRRAAIAETVSAIAEHVYSAAFNRSADVHEGNSWWARMQDVDPRVATLDAWEQATRENRFFPLTVSWKPAKATVGRVLANLLGHVETPLPTEPTAEHLAGLVMRSRARARRSSE